MSARNYLNTHIKSPAGSRKTIYLYQFVVSSDTTATLRYTTEVNPTGNLPITAMAAANSIISGGTIYVATPFGAMNTNPMAAAVSNSGGYVPPNGERVVVPLAPKVMPSGSSYGVYVGGATTGLGTAATVSITYSWDEQ